MIELIPTTIVRMALSGDEAEGMAYLYLQPAKHTTDTADDTLPKWNYLHVFHEPECKAHLVSSLSATNADVLALSALVLGHMTGTNPWTLFNTAPSTTLMPALDTYGPDNLPPVPKEYEFRYPNPPYWSDIHNMTVFLVMVGGQKPITKHILNYLTTSETL